MGIVWMKRRNGENKIMHLQGNTRRKIRNECAKDDEKIEKFPLSNLHEGKKRSYYGKKFFARGEGVCITR